MAGELLFVVVMTISCFFSFFLFSLLCCPAEKKLLGGCWWADSVTCLKGEQKRQKNVEEDKRLKKIDHLTKTKGRRRRLGSYPARGDTHREKFRIVCIWPSQIAANSTCCMHVRGCWT